MIVGSRSRVFPSVQSCSRSDLLGLSKGRELVVELYVYVCMNERVVCVCVYISTTLRTDLKGRCVRCNDGWIRMDGWMDCSHSPSLFVLLIELVVCAARGHHVIGTTQRV